MVFIYAFCLFQNMDEVNHRKGDVSNTQVVSLATETALNNTGLVFSDGTNMLASAGDLNSLIFLYILCKKVMLVMM
jgi:hypothetical protein